MLRLAGRRPLAAALLLCSLTLVAGTSVQRPPAVHVPSGAIEVDVIGDSLSTGLQTPGDPWTARAQRLADERWPNVVYVTEAENGAGYVSRGEYDDTFGDEVGRVVTSRSNVVLLFGSDNDLGQPGLSQAVTDTLRLVRARAPRAELIVVGPPAPPARQPPQLTGIRDTLAMTTERVGGRFVDPLSLGWFQGASAADVAADDEHPNTDGERFLAREMTDILTDAVDRLRGR